MSIPPLGPSTGPQDVSQQAAAGQQTDPLPEDPASHGAAGARSEIPFPSDAEAEAAHPAFDGVPPGGGGGAASGAGGSSQAVAPPSPLKVKIKPDPSVEAFKRLMNDPKSSKEDLLATYDNLPARFKNEIEGRVYWHQVKTAGEATITDPEYGEKELEKGSHIFDDALAKLHFYKSIEQLNPLIQATELTALLHSEWNAPRSFIAKVVYNVHAIERGLAICKDKDGILFGARFIQENITRLRDDPELRRYCYHSAANVMAMRYAQQKCFGITMSLLANEQCNTSIRTKAFIETHKYIASPEHIDSIFIGSEGNSTYTQREILLNALRENRLDVARLIIDKYGIPITDDRFMSEDDYQNPSYLERVRREGVIKGFRLAAIQSRSPKTISFILKKLPLANKDDLIHLFEALSKYDGGKSLIPILRSIPSWFPWDTVCTHTLFSTIVNCDFDKEIVLDAFDYLVPEFLTLSQTDFGRCLLNFSHYDALFAIEWLMQRMPYRLPIVIRDRAIRYARGENAKAIRDLLLPARVGGVLSIDIPEDHLLTRFDIVQEYPHVLLQQMAKIYPSRIRLERCQAIDVGGLSKQIITVLVEALLEKRKLSVSTSGLPTVLSSEHESVWRNFATVCSTLYERNKSRTDKILIGNVFDPAFFPLVKLLSDEDSTTGAAAGGGAAGSEEVDIKPFLELLKQISPDLEQTVDVAAGKITGDALDRYAEAMGCDNAQEALDEANELIQRYIRAAQAFREGLKGELATSIETSSDTAAQAAVELQGAELSVDDLCNSLERIPGTPDELLHGVQRWIRTSTPEQREQFAFAVLGNKRLAPGTKVEIGVIRSEAGLVVIRACFNRIEIPYVDGMTDRVLFNLIDHAIVNPTDYEMA